MNLGRLVHMPSTAFDRLSQLSDPYDTKQMNHLPSMPEFSVSLALWTRVVFVPPTFLPLFLEFAEPFEPLGVLGGLRIFHPSAITT